MDWKVWWVLGSGMTLEIYGEEKWTAFFSEERENHEDAVEGLFYGETKFKVKYIWQWNGGSTGLTGIDFLNQDQ